MPLGKETDTDQSILFLPTLQLYCHAGCPTQKGSLSHLPIDYRPPASFVSDIDFPYDVIIDLATVQQ